MPAAGSARRLGEPSSSKELEPVYRNRARPDERRPVAFCLLDALGAAGVSSAYVVTSSLKSDVRDELGSGRAGTPVLEHLVVEDSPAAAYTVSIGTQAAGERAVALGFPDVLWDGDRAFSRLSAAVIETGADVALGLFPTAGDYPTDGVQLSDPAGASSRTVQGFEPAERAAGLPTWTLAVWRPSFSRLLEREVALRYGPWTGDTPRGELSMTPVLALALEAGQSIVGVEVSDRPFLDIGEPARLEAARRACRSTGDGGGSPAT
ncbi:MAG: hypothetical protein OEU54_17225 [Gemmatimonadota bacterium]|nr:hypothetical protein [Gemmatimonadota bacterium]